ncbi:small acid-soluble spore protein (thioredoxin-like protein) [Clostridium amylolyticum]|uniref:Protein Tlp homolog n=1 Tax=Clostridium amylolyticum TaxID=1121298 RepID=A0A1M6BML8_9CLOT|nr:small acid-soluble spore protein Tlp [Clostridium amylolyticum]SHI49916.1 small acid-soluble spore protein (thioredoxin-like protein) [Clostridium amylolyticum]
MKNKPDDRTNNAARIQHNITNTIENIHRADEMIEETSDDNMRRTLEEKNKRREEALKGMKSEMKDETIARENGYK